MADVDDSDVGELLFKMLRSYFFWICLLFRNDKLPSLWFATLYLGILGHGIWSLFSVFTTRSYKFLKKSFKEFPDDDEFCPKVMQTDFQAAAILGIRDEFPNLIIEKILDHFMAQNFYKNYFNLKIFSCKNWWSYF